MVDRGRRGTLQRCAAGDGIFVQLKPDECGDFAGDDRGDRGRELEIVRAGLLDAAADAVGERAVLFPRGGKTNRGKGLTQRS